MNGLPLLARLVFVGALVAVAACANDQVVPPPDVVDPNSPAVVRWVPSTASIPVGGRVSLEVRIENGFDVGAVLFHLRHNSGLLAFEPPALEGMFLSSGGAVTAFQVADPAPGGEIMVQLSRTGASIGAIGSGLLATFGFRALAPGRAAIVFTNASVKDSDGANRPASFVGESLAIVP